MIIPVTFRPLLPPPPPPPSLCHMVSTLAGNVSAHSLHNNEAVKLTPLSDSHFRWGVHLTTCSTGVIFDTPVLFSSSDLTSSRSESEGHQTSLRWPFYSMYRICYKLITILPLNKRRVGTRGLRKKAITGGKKETLTTRIGRTIMPRSHPHVKARSVRPTYTLYKKK